MQPQDTTSPKIKVFGIGWAKTGTTSLGRCLRTLGFDHQSRDLDLAKDLARDDLSRIMARAAAKESFEDWPWILLYRAMDRSFPGSRFVLTIRKAERWLGSYRNMLARQDNGDEDLNETRRILYGLPFPDVTDEQLVERYERHNREVIEYFRGRRKDLLVVDWEKGDGWIELCEFLGMEVPNAPFPHANKGIYGKGTPLERLSAYVRKMLK